MGKNKPKADGQELQALDKDALLAALAPKVFDIPVPELGGKVLVKELDALEQTKITDLRETLENTQADNIKFMCHFLAQVLVDRNGQNLFSETEIDRLAKSKLTTLNKLFGEALDANGMSKKAEEEIEGNSEPEPTSGSPTN